MRTKQLFEQIYNDTKESTHRFIAAKCFDLNDIDDIFQNVYISVYEALIRRGRAVEDPEAFVILIAKRELFKYYGLIKRLKALIRTDKTPEECDIPDSGAYSIEDSIVDKALIDEINILLSKKSLVTQKIFYLYYHKGLTLSETASLLGISEALTKKRLYSTLAELRRLYRKEQ